ncbi:MAG: hypothetical protein ACRCST_17005 [Turicibacter sp.]
MTERSAIIIILISIVLGISYLMIEDERSKLYGNDEQTILKSIARLYQVDETAIEVIEVVDVDEYRIVGFQMDQRFGVAQFEKNDQGDYLNIKSQISGSKQSYDVHFIWKGHSFKPLIIVFSDGSELTKVKITANQTYTKTQEVELNMRSMNVIDLNIPEEVNSLTMEYIGYDRMGQEFIID